MRFRLGKHQRAPHKITAPLNGVALAENVPVIRELKRALEPQKTPEPKPRLRPIRLVAGWLLRIAAGAVARIGLALAGAGENSLLRQANRRAERAEADKVASHNQWLAHKRELLAERDESVFEKDGIIRRQASELELVKLERAALLEVLERDRERVRAETAIESAKIAGVTGGGGLSGAEGS